jgi:F-type H+-transporting ATPase subunit epsilon
MADKTFRLQIATQERVVYDEDVLSVVAPGAEGYFGILRGRAPIIAELQLGVMKVTTSDGTVKRIALTGGILECSAQGVLVLADVAERSDEIDVGRAEAAASRARRRLDGTDPQANLDAERARAALMRALNRLKAAEES